MLIFLVDKWSIRQRWNIYPNFQALHPCTSTCGVLSRTLQDLGHNTGMWCVTIPPQDYKKYATMFYVVINMELALVVDHSGMCDHWHNLDSNTVGWGGNINHACFFGIFGATAPHWARASSFTRFLDHTRHTTISRTPLDEWWARHRDLYLMTHNTQKTSMPPVGFEPTISAGERPQTHALDRAATGTGDRGC